MSDSDARDNFSDSSRDSKTVMKTSRLNVPLRSSVLRPSLFATSTVSNDSNVSEQPLASSSSTLPEDTTTSNPFLKDVPENEDSDKKQNGNENNKEDNNNKDKNDPLALLSKNGLQRSNLFAATKNSIPRVEQSGFVFGQNVHERVAGAKSVESTSKKDENTENKDLDEDLSNSGATGLLFSSAIKNNKSSTSDEGSALKENEGTKSLTEVAREYEESRAQKRKYEEVETFTGEENEVNIIDVNCKLFAFVNRNWEERGRGCLRLNDSKDENGCSRVVFRTSGSFRLLVNTKVWSGMVAERPSSKSLRLTAMDSTDGQIKVFLIMSRPDDISVLYKALTKRITRCKETAQDDDNESNIVTNAKVDGNNDGNIPPLPIDETSKNNDIIVKTSKTTDGSEDDGDGENYEPSSKIIIAAADEIETKN